MIAGVLLAGSDIDPMKAGDLAHALESLRGTKLLNSITTVKVSGP